MEVSHKINPYYDNTFVMCNPYRRTLLMINKILRKVEISIFGPVIIKYLQNLKSFRLSDQIRLLLIHRFYSNYQPMKLEEWSKNDSKRNVADRYELIKQNLSGTNCLDIGCHSGFFTLNLAREGFWVTGVDQDKIIVEKAKLLQSKYKIENATISNFKITKESVNTLPIYDNVIYLSIHHHMIKVYGFKEATEIFTNIYKKTKYKLFFDFPYPKAYEGNELFSEIPDMGENPDEWIMNYLKQVGFNKVTSLAVTEHNSKPWEKRNLFMAEK
jgi:ubiquinone/menaquinone biosynthesis C-methylase UbiE